MKTTFTTIFVTALLLSSCTPSSDTPGSSNQSSSFLSISSAGSSTPISSSSTSTSPSSIPMLGADLTGMDLHLPEGIIIEKFADGLTGARVIVKDSFDNFWVSRTSAGVITQLEMSGSTIVRKNDIFRGMKNPHGLAIDPATGVTLYIADETSVRKAHLYSDAPLETIAELPAGGRHYTRTLLIKDKRLYVSIGSTCDACVEKNELHGTVISMNLDGSDQKIISKGLRNAVFLQMQPETRQIWATEMGRDMLGDDIPPEEVNIIREGAHYGWPYCYGNRVRDINITGEFDCTNSEPPYLTMQAHTAPLGLAFIPNSWPAAYRDDLLVAQHGSWNRSTPVGYRIIRFPLDAQGKPEGEPVDFIYGWRDVGAAIGRPVDLFFDENALYATDDKAGVVYRIRLN